MGDGPEWMRTFQNVKQSASSEDQYLGVLEELPESGRRMRKWFSRVKKPHFQGRLRRLKRTEIVGPDFPRKNHFRKWASHRFGFQSI